MVIKVPAIYENGVLRLFREIELPEHSRVEVQIELSSDSETISSENVLQRLAVLATDLGVDDLAEQHDHYLYRTEKQ
jgi:predicted DNA-binding antitoxin AbrB/MazE fold protein